MDVNCLVVDVCLVFDYRVEWVFGDASESSKETPYIETISQDFLDIWLISEGLGSITSWGSFLT